MRNTRANRKARNVSRSAIKRAAWSTCWHADLMRRSERDGVAWAIRSARRALAAGRPIALFHDSPDFFGVYSRDSTDGSREADAYDEASVAIATLVRQQWIDVERYRD